MSFRFILASMLLLPVLFTACVKKDKSKSSSSVAACSTCKIFVSTSTYNGNLGGISGADQKCNADVKSGSDVYKALLAGRTVLQANTIYTRTNGTTVGTTDSSEHLTFPLTAPVVASTAFPVWTGFDTSWGVDFTCSSWTDGTNGSTFGSVGDAGANDITLIAFNSAAYCSDARYILCVQQ